MSAFQFKLDDRSATFSENAIWEGDQLCRDETSRQLYALIAGQENPVTICLNGEWGSGKTYFLTRFDRLFNTRNPVGRSVYFNAWQDDFLGDPLLAIICQLKKAAPDDVSVSLYESLKKAALPCLAKIGLSAAKQVLKNKIGIDADTLAVDDLSSELETAYKRYEQLDESRELLRDALSKFAMDTWEKTQKPLLFIIDELDRCRPTFAIEVLERIKHLFSVPHLVFLIGVDIKQLSKSVRAVYGEVDSDDYLHRFFDLELMLPKVDKMPFVYSLWEEHGLEGFAKRHGVGINSQRCTVDEFAHLIKYKNLSLRQIEKCVRTYGLLAMSKESYSCKWALLVAIAVVLKVTKDDAYGKFVRMELGLGELINLLYPGASYRDVADSESGVFPMVQHLSKIIYYGGERHPSRKGVSEIRNAIEKQQTIHYDASVMPECFSACTANEIASFYQYTFTEQRICQLSEYKEVPAMLAKMDAGLRFLGK